MKNFHGHSVHTYRGLHTYVQHSYMQTDVCKGEIKSVHLFDKSGTAADDEDGE
jgi:hypothetical protein